MEGNFSIPVWATFSTQQVASLTPVSWTFSVKRLIRFSGRKSPIVAASFYDVFGLELSNNPGLPGEWHNMAVCLWVIKWRCVCSVRSMHTSLGNILWRGGRNMSILRYLFISLKLPSLHWCSYAVLIHGSLIWNSSEFVHFIQIIAILYSTLLMFQILRNWVEFLKYLQQTYYLHSIKWENSYRSRKYFVKEIKLLKLYGWWGRLNLHCLNSGSRANNRRSYLD